MVFPMVWMRRTAVERGRPINTVRQKPGGDRVRSAAKRGAGRFVDVDHRQIQQA